MEKDTANEVDIDVSTETVVRSNAFHVMHNADSLELVNPLPSKIEVNESLPDMEVRIMGSTNFIMHKYQKTPVKFPLTAGPDTDVYITLTISWDQKIFASNLAETRRSDIAQLIHSNVKIASDSMDVSVNYLGDLVIRQRSKLLPKGHYGAVFSGIKILNVASDVRFNFTMTYPTDLTRMIDGFEDPVITSNDDLMLYYWYTFYSNSDDNYGPNNFERVGLGFHDWAPIWENSTTGEFMDHSERDVYIPTFGEAVNAKRLAETHWKNGLANGSDNSIQYYKDFPGKLYSGYGDSVVRVPTSRCENITDTALRAKCTSSGVTVDLARNNGPGVLISSPIEVTVKAAASLKLTWLRDTTWHEVGNVPSWEPVVLEIRDSAGNVITGGQDAVAKVAATAYYFDIAKNQSVNINICNEFRDDVEEGCRAANMADAAKDCFKPTPRLLRGRLEHHPSLCLPGFLDLALLHASPQAWARQNVKIQYSVTTSNGVELSATTQAFNIEPKINIGILLPRDTKANADIELNPKHLRIIFETIFGGGGFRHLGMHPAYPIIYDGSRQKRMVPKFVYLSGTASDNIAQIKAAHAKHRFRRIFGPFETTHVADICSWAHHEMPDVMLTQFITTSELPNQVDNCVQVVPSMSSETDYFSTAIAKKQWNRIAIVQDRGSRQLGKAFYDSLRAQNIEILADIDLDSRGFTLHQNVEALKAAGAYVILSTVASAKAAAFYNLAAQSNITEPQGYQWLGDGQARVSFPWDTIEDVEVHFGRMAFFNQQLGAVAIGSDDLAWKVFKHLLMKFGSEATGGNDPLHTDARNINLFDADYIARGYLNGAMRSEIINILDTAIYLQHVIDQGNQYVGEQVASTAAHAMWSVIHRTDCGVLGRCRFKASLFGRSLEGHQYDESGGRNYAEFTWTQLVPNLFAARDAFNADYAPNHRFSPWTPTTAWFSVPTLGFVESEVFDRLNNIKYPATAWAPAAVLTTISVPVLHPDEDLPRMQVQKVPVTHRCKQGCGGELVDPDFGYTYELGACTNPDTCTCVSVKNSTGPGTKAAFEGLDCNTPICDDVCIYGVCKAARTCNDHKLANKTVAMSNISAIFSTHIIDVSASNPPNASVEPTGVEKPRPCFFETQCVCEKGWAGPKCDVALCFKDGCSADHGSCDLPDACTCDELYFGASCESKCSCEFGECNDGATGSGECTCDSGIFGDQCNLECTCLNGVCNDGTQGNGICTSCDSGWIGDNCDTRLMFIVIPAVVGFIILGLLIRYIVNRFIKKQKELALLANLDWKIDFADILFQKDASTTESLMFQSMGFKSRASVGGAQANAVSRNKRVGKYKDQVVHVKVFTTDDVPLTDALRAEVKCIRESKHQNIVEFAGACIDAPNVCIVTVFGAKGSLDDILLNEDIKLPWDFRDSIMKDIANGLKFLHASSIQSHGRLKSSNCIVDSRWTVKLTDFGLQSMRLQASNEDEECMEETDTWQPLLWTAPELLGGEVDSLDAIGKGTKSGDVYSLGIIFNEIMKREGPYDDIGLSSTALIELLARQSEHSNTKAASKSIHQTFQGDSVDLVRPTLPLESQENRDYLELTKQCWDNSPGARPTAREVVDLLNRISPCKGEMVDNLIHMLEQYASGLEGLVAKRTVELEAEKAKVDELVSRMLPKAVAEDLKQGKNVKPESFDNVSVFFSDIVGFTSICSKSTPMEVVEMLNHVYSTFDAIAEEYDVYKVETIGDAYMVVSGLPIRNGDDHAGEISSFALHLLSAMIDFRIPHMPDERLQLRIGIHTGPVVAGVVGVKMPRYCLFGDTVNTASRMESGGFALRIHVSPTTTKLLEKLGGYHLESRGEIAVKGRGNMTTAWLNGKDGFTKPLPTAEMATSLSQHEFK